FHDAVEGPREVEVIGVDIAQDPSRGPSEACVDGLRLALIPLADPGHREAAAPAGPRTGRDTVGIALDDLDAAGGGASVHHEVLDLEVALLRQHALDGFADESRLIVGGCDDADPGCHRHRLSHSGASTRCRSRGPRARRTDSALPLVP